MSRSVTVDNEKDSRKKKKGSEWIEWKERGREGEKNWNVERGRGMST